MPNHRKLSRRDFLKISAASAVLGIVPPSIFRRAAAQAQPTDGATLPNGIAVGDVTQTSAVFWAHSTATGTATVTYSESTAWFDWLAHHRQRVEVADPTIPAKVQVNDLRPGVEYTYHVSDAAGAEWQGRFVTPPAEGKPGLHFGVSGDWRGELRPYVSLGNVAARTLDFFLEHGDTIYGDVPSLDFPGGSARTLSEYRVKHNEVYSTRYGRNVWADIRASTAIYATIDDHEVCNDFAGGAPPSSDGRFDGTSNGEAIAFINQTDRYRAGVQSFREYNPVREEVYEDTGDPSVDGRPKLYRFQTFGSTAAIFILDARSFRDQEEPQIAPIQVINPLAVQRSLASMFTPGRTMLGRPQMAQLKTDLLAAHQSGITWKFVMVPEPIQHMGWFGGVDRWEGYAPERTEILRFIEDNAIRNVVFVSADVHTTFINNLTYQTEAGGAQIPTHCFEISTEAAAFYPPTGQIIMDAAAQLGLLPKERRADYQSMTPAQKDAVLQDIFNSFVLGGQGFTPLGLDDSLVNWQRTQGETWVIGHSFGWCEFEIAPETETLTITTWGVPAYSPEQAASDPDAILALTPEIMNQLVITPQTT